MVNESKTFCVVKPKTGNAIKFEHDDVKQFLPHISEAEFAWVNVQVGNLETDGPAVAVELGFTANLVTNLVKEHYSSYEDLGTELGLLMPAVSVHEFEVQTSKLLIFIKGNIILTLHGASVTRLLKFSRYASTFFQKIPRGVKIQDKISHLLIRIIEENNERNFEGIRKIQELGERISTDLVEPTTRRKDLGINIHHMKAALLKYLETLWATLDVIQYLRYGDPDQLTDDTKILQKIGLLGSDITMQISISEQMSTVLASGLEVLQSIYNNQLQMLNNRLAFIVTWLTILGTAVLVPNTIATVFGIPAIAEHMNWKVTVGILIGSTVLAVGITYWFIYRWKKSFPAEMM